jgi:membrane-associated PAP2 superfamily phosphatase
LKLLLQTAAKDVAATAAARASSSSSMNCYSLCRRMKSWKMLSRMLGLLLLLALVLPVRG